MLRRLSWLGMTMVMLLILYGCGGSQGQSGSNGAGESTNAFTALQLDNLRQPPAPPKTAIPSAGTRSGPSINKGQVSTQIYLYAGWNTISFPFQSVTSTSGFLYCLYKFNGYGYDEVDPGAHPELIDCHYGYWAYTATPVTVEVQGYANASITAIGLNYGWNFIGVPFDQAQYASSVKLTHDFQQSLIQGSSYDIPPGSGKWVYAYIYDYRDNIWRKQDLEPRGSNVQFDSGWGFWVWCWNNTETTTLDFTAPLLSSLNPDNGTISATVSLAGLNFGATQGSNQVTFNGLNASIASWSDTLIVALVPPGATTGLVSVIVNDVGSNAIMFTVIEPWTGWNWFNPRPWGNNFRGVWGSGNQAWAVGDSGGAIIHYNGSSWSQMSSGTPCDLNDIWGTSSNDIYAVGAKGTVLHYDGSSWSPVPNGFTEEMVRVQDNRIGSSLGSIFSVSPGGMTKMPGPYVYASVEALSGNYVLINGGIYYYNGTSWGAKFSPPGTYRNYALLALNDNDIYVAGNGMAHYNGSSWSTIYSYDSNYRFKKFFSFSASDIYAFSPSTIYHFNGSTWENFLATPVTALGSASSCWLESSFNIFVTGSLGYLNHYNGNAWTDFRTFEDIGRINAIWGSSAQDVYFSGETSNKLKHYNGSSFSEIEIPLLGTVYALWGTAADNLYAACSGNWGLIRFNGNSWDWVWPGTSISGNCIWGNRPDNIYVGSRSWSSSKKEVIVHYNGTSWSTSHSTGTEGDFLMIEQIWGNADNDIYAVKSDGTGLHYNGTTWDNFDLGIRIYDIWGSSSNNVYAAGMTQSSQDVIMHFNGSGWETVFSGSYNIWFTKFWGSSASDIYVQGKYGLCHFNGNSWQIYGKMYENFWNNGMNTIWGSSPLDIYIGGDSSQIVHYGGQ